MNSHYMRGSEWKLSSFSCNISLLAFRNFILLSSCFYIVNERFVKIALCLTGGNWQEHKLYQSLICCLHLLKNYIQVIGNFINNQKLDIFIYSGSPTQYFLGGARFWKSGHVVAMYTSNFLNFVQLYPNICLQMILCR